MQNYQPEKPFSAIGKCHLAFLHRHLQNQKSGTVVGTFLGPQNSPIKYKSTRFQMGDIPNTVKF